MHKEFSAKDATFTLHIDGREAVEIDGYEVGNPDQILVDAAFMKMARYVDVLLKQRAELLEALKKLLPDAEDGISYSHQDWGDEYDPPSSVVHAHDVIAKYEETK